jgi:energy-converting hydrogenase B subunit E
MMTQIVLLIGFLLSLTGLWGLMTRRDLFRMIISFSLLDTGVHIIMVGIGYVKNGTAPIFDEALSPAGAVEKVVDPIPSALVLTAIVIGLAVTALMLSYAVRVYTARKSLSVDAVKELRW